MMEKTIHGLLMCYLPQSYESSEPRVIVHICLDAIYDYQCRGVVFTRTIHAAQTNNMCGKCMDLTCAPTGCCHLGKCFAHQCTENQCIGECWGGNRRPVTKCVDTEVDKEMCG